MNIEKIITGKYRIFQSLDGAVRIELSKNIKIPLTIKQMIFLPFDVKKLKDFREHDFRRYYKIRL